MDAETRALIEEAQKGSKDALEELTNKNIKMIQKIANMYKRTKHDPEDLFQLACVGFVRAVQKFDLSTGYHLSTYAYRLIHNEIYKFLRVEGTIRTPRPIQKVDKLIKKHNCVEKAPEEIAEIIGIDDIDLIKETLIFIHKGRVISLNQVLYSNNEGDDVTLEDTVTKEESIFWDDNLALKDAIAQLDKREQQIVTMRYKQDMTQREVAKVLGVTQVQISRLEIRLLSKIRVYMGLPAELPKEEKKPKLVQPKKPKEGPKGDREEAIHLLKTSTLSYPDIAKITGVPLGSMYKLGGENRPKELKDIVKKRATQQKGELNVYEA